MTIARAAIDAIVSHARASAPDECCGLLIGDGDRVASAYSAANLEPSPSRFLLDPRDHFAAIRAARSQGCRVVGVYHSHPDAPAAPSSRDLADASYPDYLYLIVSLQGASPDVRLYELANGNFRERALVSVA